jgi:hypothetical protein
MLTAATWYVANQMHSHLRCGGAHLLQLMQVHTISADFAHLMDTGYASRSSAAAKLSMSSGSADWVVPLSGVWNP